MEIIDRGFLQKNVENMAKKKNFILRKFHSASTDVRRVNSYHFKTRQVIAHRCRCVFYFEFLIFKPRSLSVLISMRVSKDQSK